MPYHVIISRQVLLDGPMTFFATGALVCLAYLGRTQQGRWLMAAAACLGRLGSPVDRARVRVGCQCGHRSRHPTRAHAVELPAQATSIGAVFAAMRRRAAVGSLAAVALVFAWANTNSGAHWGLAALYGISVTVTPITGCFLALLRGRAVGIIEACYEAGRQIALPALGIAAIQLGLGVWGVLAVYVTIDVIAAMLIAVLARRRLGLSPVVDVDEESELRLRQTLPLSATGIVGNAYERVDSALLAPLAGLTAVGIYRMVTPIVGAVLMPAKAFARHCGGRGRAHRCGRPARDGRALRDTSHHHHGARCAPARDRRSDRASARLAGTRDGVEPASD